MDEVTVTMKLGALRKIARDCDVLCKGLYSMEGWLLERKDFDEEMGLRNYREYLQTVRDKFVVTVNAVTADVIQAGIQARSVTHSIRNQEGSSTANQK